MRKIIWLTVLIAALSGCGTSTLFRRAGSTDTRTASLQALQTTVRSTKLLVTAAAALADAGIISEPQWRKVAAASVNAGNALQAWHDALKANKDTSEFPAVVAQALAVLEVLIPEASGKRSALPSTTPSVAPVDLPTTIHQLTTPAQFRRAA